MFVDVIAGRGSEGLEISLGLWFLERGTEDPRLGVNAVRRSLGLRISTLVDLRALCTQEKCCHVLR